ncbi:hypothetical protein CCACVL1_12794 [Corchorus capsularis]|uniref:Uncharacterized protein n=1 Tax=Corchorus capsularis TaxID=210143 RepID=A0A1R3IDR8_COCAP|nr:hypothetical protein CCACVL1_12794 [Corchorus capsularis]
MERSLRRPFLEPPSKLGIQLAVGEGVAERQDSLFWDSAIVKLEARSDNYA